MLQISSNDFHSKLETWSVVKMFSVYFKFFGISQTETLCFITPVCVCVCVHEKDSYFTSSIKNVFTG